MLGRCIVVSSRRRCLTSYGPGLTKGSQNGCDTWLFRHFARKCGEGDIDRVAKCIEAQLTVTKTRLFRYVPFAITMLLYEIKHLLDKFVGRQGDIGKQWMAKLRNKTKCQRPQSRR